MKRRPRAYQVILTVHAHRNANIDTVRSLIHDLEWVGGCRDPDSPDFASLEVSAVKIHRAKEKDRAI